MTEQITPVLPIRAFADVNATNSRLLLISWILTCSKTQRHYNS